MSVMTRKSTTSVEIWALLVESGTDIIFDAILDVLSTNVCLKSDFSDLSNFLFWNAVLTIIF